MLLFIAIIIFIVYLSTKLIIKSFSRSENYYEYVKSEMDVRCNYEDYAFVTRKLGN